VVRKKNPVPEAPNIGKGSFARFHQVLDWIEQMAEIDRQQTGKSAASTLPEWD